MARPKKVPITVGKGTSYTRPTNPGSNPRPVSAKPSQASKVRAVKKTTSSGITRRPDGRRQSEGRAVRQSVSNARVTTSSNGKPKGPNSVKVTQGRSQSPRLPQLPRNPTTTNTIRALGGNSSDAKINRLSAQARPTSGVKSAPEFRKEAIKRVATRALIKTGGKRAGAVATGAALFLQGQSGSALDKAVQKLPGIKANPNTDLGARASRAIMNAFKKKKKKR